MSSQIEFYKPENTNYEANGDVTLEPSSALFAPTLNNTWELEIIHPYDKEGRWKLLQGDGIIKCDIPEHEGGELFYIYDFDKGLNDILVKARQIFYEEVGNTIADRRSVDDTGQQALDTILQFSDFTGHSDILDLRTCYYVKTNVVAAVNGSEDNTFVNRWGGDIWHNKYDLYVNKRVGRDRGVRIEYGSNLININLKENHESIITRAYPWAENDYRYSGRFIDSPLINKYRKPKEAYVDMSDIPVKSTGNEEGYDDDVVDSMMRRRVEVMWEEGADKPTIEGTVEVASLENTSEYKFIKNLVSVRLGDDVSVYHQDIGIELKARCVSYTWNILTQKFESVTIGQVEKTSFEKQADIEHKVNSSIDNNGNVIGERVKGFLNGMETGIRTNLQVATQKEPVIMLTEVTDQSSVNYGARLTTPSGEYFASEKDQYGEWKWRHAITNKGLVGDYIYGGNITSLNGIMELALNNGTINILQEDGGQLQIDNKGIRRKARGDSLWSINYLTAVRYQEVTISGSGNGSFSFNLEFWQFKNIDVWNVACYFSSIYCTDSSASSTIKEMYVSGTGGANGIASVSGRLSGYNVSNGYVTDSDGNYLLTTSGNGSSFKVMVCVIAIG